ncbi:hypothetical protein JCM14469_34550 [Desulfatiferula olefinivorans]
MPESLTWREFFCVEKLNRIGRHLKHGAVVFDQSKCIGCGLCEKACFTGAIVGTGDKRPTMIQGVESLCVSCGACTAICPEGAIEISEFIEFYRYFKWLDRDTPCPPRRF